MSGQQQDTTRLPLFFEYPCNEQLRIYLRIEHMFEQISQRLNTDDAQDHAIVIREIFGLIDFLHRNDVKSCVLKHLDARITEYVVLKDNPEVDVDKLNNFLNQLKSLQHWIYKHQGKFGQLIQNSEFWSSLKRRFEGKSHLSPYDIPQLLYFLHLDPQRRREQLTQLLEEFQSIKTSVSVLLNLLRTSATKQRVKAENGLYHHDHGQHNCQLLRLWIPEAYPLYPEISVGNHRFIIRFHSVDELGKMPVYAEDISFELSLCH